MPFEYEPVLRHHFVCRWHSTIKCMMTSSNGTFSVLLAPCAGNSPVSGEFPTQRTVTRSFYIFFDLRLNKRLSKQSCGWWFETQSSSLWRHCYGNRNCDDKAYRWLSTRLQYFQCVTALLHFLSGFTGCREFWFGKPVMLSSTCFDVLVALMKGISAKWFIRTTVYTTILKHLNMINLPPTLKVNPFKGVVAQPIVSCPRRVRFVEPYLRKCQTRQWRAIHQTFQNFMTAGSCGLIHFLTMITGLVSD